MMRSRLVIAFAAIAVCAAGCAKDEVEEARKRAAESGNPHGAAAPSPHGGAPSGTAPMTLGSDTGPGDGHAIPLKVDGIGSAAEMRRELPSLGGGAAAEQFERAFRLTFSSDPAKRNPAEAKVLLTELLTTSPEFAPAYRTLAYVEFNLDPSNAERPLEHYAKAVELEPGYGEAHYAIAFMCAATGDRARGVEHYKRAMELGVTDERGIGQRFYADLLAPK